MTGSFDPSTGRLISLEREEGGGFRGLFAVDIGCDGHYVGERLEFQSFAEANTWELPRVRPLTPLEEKWALLGCAEEADGVWVTQHALSDLKCTVRYRFLETRVEVEASFVNESDSVRWINGVAFLFAIEAQGSNPAFEFPGNVPYRQFQYADLADGAVIETGLVNPVVRIDDAGEHFNLIFVDETEKWGTGVCRIGDHLLCVQLAAVEAELQPGESLDCGTLYLQPVGSGEPFAPIRALYREKGWTPPRDGHREGVLYSCHPHGTMDAGFPLRRDLREYAREFDGLREMGVDHVWLLPIFEHLDRGVYHPTDQRIIDERYGGAVALAAFSRHLHSLGMTLLFDYVPHGPAPEDAFAVAHQDWASVRRDGERQLEWNCLSFDMTNPEYLQYTKDLVKEHVALYDADGARIDCAMGGLSNWRPQTGTRPSRSNLGGGVLISQAIRDGFAESGKKPIVTPENFNPVPVYAPYTDLFYDMALFRAILEMEWAGLPPERYARELTRWLRNEMLSSPEGCVKLRFLGNHDTVTWVWNKSRATTFFGVEKAKALWVLLSLIDGVPMLYQGDEDAAIYGKDGPELRTFFRELIYARRTYVDNSHETVYDDTGTPIISFFRTKGEEAKWVVVNLSPEAAECPIPGGESRSYECVYGHAELQERRLALPGYGYAMLLAKEG